MFKQFYNRRGIFVFSDPGGAKGVLAVASGLKREGETDLHIFSDRNYDFYDDFGFNVTHSDSDLIQEQIEKIKPDYIFTGTSYTSIIEIETLKIATDKKIRSYAFVDHWTNIKKRFIHQENIYYPDELWLIDPEASKIALTEGVPEEIIKITGNPYHEFLKSWHSLLSKKNLSDILSLKLTDKNKLILYVPEPFSNVGGVEKYDFDETTILRTLLELFQKDVPSAILLVKPHPNQKAELLKEVLSKYDPQGVNSKITDTSHTNNLIYHSDLIIGISSNILIEAQIIGKNIIRYCPTGYSDPLYHLNIGTVVNTINQVHKAIRAQFPG